MTTISRGTLVMLRSATGTWTRGDRSPFKAWLLLCEVDSLAENADRVAADVTGVAETFSPAQTIKASAEPRPAAMI
jgi:hypothetical protein